jgi:hypothetical protein
MACALDERFFYSLVQNARQGGVANSPIEISQKIAQFDLVYRLKQDLKL